jgi:hypothetical protein
MSLGKVTFLSADCDGSGAVVGSSGVVADSSGADGGGCPGGAAGVWDVEDVGDVGGVAGVVEAVVAPRVAAGVAVGFTEAARAGALACSAARRVTNAAPDKITPLRAITQIDRLFGITHHSKT